MPITKLDLDRSSDRPLQDQIALAIRARIADGRLVSGERLPASRVLADDLGVNRGTVSAAYDLLAEDGVLTGQVGRGTFVSEPSASADGGFRWNDHFVGFDPAPRPRIDAGDDTDLISFGGNIPDEELFPTDMFRRAIDHVLREEGNRLLAYGSASGHPRFLEFLNEYLTGRGVESGDGTILAVNGSQQAMDLVARAFLRPGDTVLVEEPTYWGALELLRSYRVRFVGVPIDAEGIRIPELETILARERPKIAYLMPTFQNPTGSCLSLKRREAVLALVRRYQVPLIEDDFDSELYYDEPPPLPLKGLSGSEGVIHIGTPSKILFPGLRVGWLVAALPVIARLTRVKQAADLSGSPLLQAALARFAEKGQLGRHTQLVRRRYGKRRDLLLRALTDHMPDGVTWTRPPGGLSLLVALPEGTDTEPMLEAAVAEGVLYSPGRLFYLKDGARYLRLSFGNVPDHQIDEGVQRLARVVRRTLETPRTGKRERRASLPPV